MKMIRHGFIGAAAALLLMTTGFELNAQEASSAPSQEGPTALSETYQDWVINCEQVGAADEVATRSCQMSQELSQKGSNQRVLLFSIVPAVDGAASRATIIAPFGLKLSEGLGLVVDEEDIATVPFDTCLPAGCVAYLKLDAATLDKLRASETAQVVLQPRQSQEPLIITVSLVGFTSALERLNSLQQ